MDLQKRFEELEKRVAFLEKNIRADVDWKMSAKIWYAQKFKGPTEIAKEYGLTIYQVRKICLGRSPAEVEYKKQTGKDVDTDIDAFSKWRTENL